MDEHSGIRVLIVDDNQDLARAMAMVLRHNGYDTAVAFNGHQAIEEAGSFRPTVVILDIGLPDRNGFDVARTLRKDVGLDRATIIAASAWERDTMTSPENAEVIDDYIVKPINLSGLLKTLDRSSDDDQLGRGATSER
ncbi:MAG: response regulator [Isosphaeraceae bacterium]